MPVIPLDAGQFSAHHVGMAYTLGHKLSIQDRVRRLVGERVTTHEKFAEGAGISRRTLFSFLNTGKAWLDTAEKIERHLVALEKVSQEEEDAAA